MTKRGKITVILNLKFTVETTTVLILLYQAQLGISTTAERSKSLCIDQMGHVHIQQTHTQSCILKPFLE